MAGAGLPGHPQTNLNIYLTRLHLNRISFGSYSGLFLLFLASPGPDPPVSASEAAIEL